MSIAITSPPLYLPHSNAEKLKRKAILFLNETKQSTVALFCLLPVQVIRIVGVALSIFGCHTVRNFGNKLHAILIEHNLSHSCLFDPTILCRVKNIASKRVIWKEDDVKESKTFVQNLIKNVPGLKDVQLPPVRGAKINGICFGASIEVIDSLLCSDEKESTQIDSEEKLVQHLQSYQYGFSEKAAAMQHLHEAVNSFSNSCAKDASAFSGACTKVTHQINQLRENQNKMEEAKFEKKFSALNKNCDLLESKKKTLEEKLKIKEEAEQKLLSPLGLEFNEWISFEGTKGSDTSIFDRLEGGYYQLRFDVTSSSGHSIVYIKKDFGSYLLDPNYGLIKCNETNPQKTLSKLLKKYYRVKAFKPRTNLSIVQIHRQTPCKSSELQ